MPIVTQEILNEAVSGAETLQELTDALVEAQDARTVGETTPRPVVAQVNALSEALTALVEPVTE